MEERTEEGHIFRLEGENKGGKVLFMWTSRIHGMVLSYECMK